MPEEKGELPGISGVYTRIRERFTSKETGQENLATAEVSLIEEAIGITFEETPRKVTPQFRDWLIEMSPLISSLLPEKGGRVGKFLAARRRELAALIAAELLPHTNPEGFYSQTTKRCFVLAGIEYEIYDRDGLMKEVIGVSLASLHEVMHAYHDQKDKIGVPVGMKGLLELKGFYESIKRKRLLLEEIRSQFERFTVGRIFVEGIAEYGSRQTHAKILDKWEERLMAAGMGEEEVASFIDKVNFRTNRPIDISEENMQRSLETAGEFVETQSAWLSSRKAKIGPRLLRRMVEAYMELNKDVYPLGFYFVNEAMRDLVKRGLSKAEALNLLISSPPEILKEIANPKDYLARLRIEGIPSDS